MKIPRDLEHELFSNTTVCQWLVREPSRLRELYQALCNNQFWPLGDQQSLTGSHTQNGYWSCSWRTAAHIVLDLYNISNDTSEPADYCQWYCSGEEGHVSDQIQQIMSALNWEIRPYSLDM